MSTRNIPFSIKENKLKLSKICSYWIFFKGLKDEFETALVNEPSVFEPLKFYCTYHSSSFTLINEIILSRFCKIMVKY